MLLTLFSHLDTFTRADWAALQLHFENAVACAVPRARGSPKKPCLKPARVSRAAGVEMRVSPHLAPPLCVCEDILERANR